VNHRRPTHEGGLCGLGEEGRHVVADCAAAQVVIQKEVGALAATHGRPQDDLVQLHEGRYPNQ
jgi:hypothetical protein